jgi:hypothetical protein
MGTMKKVKNLLGFLVAVSLGGDVALAQGDVRLAGGEAVFTLSLPVVLPQLVVVQPGVSVVPGSAVEVFYANGYYWSRRDQIWYRTHDHRGAWTRVDDRRVPAGIASSPPGRYRNYEGEKHGGEKKGHGNGKGHDGGHG